MGAQAAMTQAAPGEGPTRVQSRLSWARWALPRQPLAILGR